jgi:ubiquinone/menaquinone biosynthesis C-methylase UbiE
MQPEPTLPDHPFRYSFTTCFKERVIADLLPLKNGDRVLELGCGSAYFETVLRRRFSGVEFQYVGLDMSAEALSTSAKFIDPQRSKLITGDVCHVPENDSSFDVVLYLDVIEHVADDRASLNEVRRLLKPGGTLILSTPNLSAPLTDTFFCEYMHDHGLMDNHRAGYSKEELSRMLSEAGLQLETVRYSNVFLSEFLITLTKLGYRMKKSRYSSQADMLDVSDSLLFKLHKSLVFPTGYAVGRLEEMFFAKWCGHCLIMKVNK